MKLSDYARKSPIIKPYDLIVLIAIVIIAIVAVVVTLQPEGQYVEITLDGEKLYELPLDEDKTIEIEDVGIVIIEDSSVRIIESTCPDKLCETKGRISRVGDSIICLPNRLIITIVGESEWDIIV